MIMLINFELSKAPRPQKLERTFPVFTSGFLPMACGEGGQRGAVGQQS